MQVFFLVLNNVYKTILLPQTLDFVIHVVLIKQCVCNNLVTSYPRFLKFPEITCIFYDLKVLYLLSNHLSLTLTYRQTVRA